MNNIKIVSLQLVKDGTFKTEYEKKINRPEDASKLCIQLLGNKAEEHLVQLNLNTKNTITSICFISKGSLNSSVVHPREVFKYAIMANAASIIIAHNHPSNDCSPSQEDINITRRLNEVGRLVGIELLDHLIVSDTSFVSLKERGII